MQRAPQTNPNFSNSKTSSYRLSFLAGLVGLVFDTGHHYYPLHFLQRKAAGKIRTFFKKKLKTSPILSLFSKTVIRPPKNLEAKNSGIFRGQNLGGKHC